MSAFGSKADMPNLPQITDAAALTFAVDLTRFQDVDWDALLSVSPWGFQAG